MPGMIDFILNIDTHLVNIVNTYGGFSYFIVFLILFAETGFVVTPFLPGDSLLFAIGALASKGGFELLYVYPLLLLAVIGGDNTNYWIGRKIGRKAFSGKFLINESHLEKTEHFYEKHGAKAVILARFMPFIRTFAPFVAGVGKMQYSKFLAYSIGGGVCWISLFVFGGYFFGNIPFISKNFEFVILAIIGLSVLPPLVGYAKGKLRKK